MIPWSLCLLHMWLQLLRPPLHPYFRGAAVAVDINDPTVALVFGTLVVPSKPLLWAVCASLTPVPVAFCDTVSVMPGMPMVRTPLHGSGWTNTSLAQDGTGSAPSQLPG